ncbi:MAG TPA: hypothetical protein VF600_07740 [Abditibacteriaceae bacterium]
MKTTLSSALLGAGCALVVSAAIPATAHADSVMTINPDGSVVQVESAQDGFVQDGFVPGSSTQGGSPQAFSNDVDVYGQGAGYTNGGGNMGYTGTTAFGGYSGYSGGVNTPLPSSNSAAMWGTQGTAGGAGLNSYGNSRGAAGSTPGLRPQSRSTLGNVTAQHRGRGNGRNDRDLIIDGDDNTVIVLPGNGYGGYYPGYGGYYPGYGWAGYPGWGYPGYGYSRFYYPNYGIVSLNPSFAGMWPGQLNPGFQWQWPGQVYGPGTYSTGFTGTLSGGFGGFSVGTGGLNIGLGGGRQRVDSHTTTTVMPGTTVSTGAASPFVMPSNNTAVTNTFVMPNRGSRMPNQRGANLGSRGNMRGF